MKTKLFIMATIISVATTTNAQKFGTKLAEKLNEKMQAASGPSKKELEEASSDSSSTFLDSKEVIKDSRGLSGIYYSTTAIHAKTMGNIPKHVKKFLVNYDEKNYTVTLNTQYSYETKDESKYVKAALWLSITEPKKLGPEISAKAGSLYLSATDYDNSKFSYFAGYSVNRDLQGNYNVQGESMNSTWDSRDFLEIEPGIILIGNLRIGLDGSDNALALNKQYKEVVVLYKAEKAANAEKYTREYAWDKIGEFWKKYNAASREIEASSTELDNPFAGTIKDEPSNADLRKAVEARMTEYKWGETLEYVYIASDWFSKYEKLGAAQLNTLLYRYLEVQVITKKGDVCRATTMFIRQNNLYTTGSIGENYSGQPIFASGNTGTMDIDCKRAYQYKNN